MGELKYLWDKQACRHGLDKCDPEAVGRLFQKLANSEDLTAARVLAEAAKPNSPLHAAPGWLWGSDDEAARKYRLGVASAAISTLRTVRVVADRTGRRGEPVMAFVQTGKVIHRGHGDVYRPTSAVMLDPLHRAQLLTRLLSAARELERTYAVLLAEYPQVADPWRAFCKAVADNIPPSAPQ